MKLTKIALCLFFAIILFSCTENGNVVTGQNNYEIEIIDDCEYLKKYEGYQSGYTFSHKGNCKNPIHYRIQYDTIYVIDGKILNKN